MTILTTSSVHVSGPYIRVIKLTGPATDPTDLTGPPTSLARLTGQAIDLVGLQKNEKNVEREDGTLLVSSA